MNTQTETRSQLLAGVSEETVREAQAIEIRAENKPLGYQLKDREKQFFAALPAHIPAERFIRIIMTAVNNSPALWHANRQSFWNACMRAAQDGLLPDGRDGALVIFNTKEKDEKGKDVWIAKVQWMPMIGGIRKKVRNSGEIKDWNAQVVHAKDHFEFELGDAPYIKHRPFMDGEPGPVIAAYSIAQFKSGELSREVMTRAQIEKVRSVSRSKDKGPWVDWFDEMCRKTVARRHSKSLPMSSDLDDLIRRDDELYDLDAKSDKQASPPLKSIGARLGALAAVASGPASEPEPEADFQPTGDETDNDTRGSVGAGAGDAAAVNGDPPAPRQEPQTGGEASQATSKTVSPPETKTPAPQDEQARKARIAEITADGDARAKAGTAALNNFLDQLAEDGERSLVSNIKVKAWQETAHAVSAKGGSQS